MHVGQHAASPGIPFEDGGQQVARSATDVDHRLTVGEFAGVGHCLRLITMTAEPA
jgi:hypothetical protein